MCESLLFDDSFISALLQVMNRWGTDKSVPLLMWNRGELTEQVVVDGQLMICKCSPQPCLNLTFKKNKTKEQHTKLMVFFCQVDDRKLVT